VVARKQKKEFFKPTGQNIEGRAGLRRKKEKQTDRGNLFRSRAREKESSEISMLNVPVVCGERGWRFKKKLIKERQSGGSCIIHAPMLGDL